VTLGACLACFVLYYVMTYILSAPPIASFLQPQLSGIFPMMFGAPIYWVMVTVIPVFAVVPDITIRLLRLWVFNIQEKITYTEVPDIIISKNEYSNNPDAVRVSHPIAGSPKPLLLHHEVETNKTFEDAGEAPQIIFSNDQIS
jgi:hypothetical protein